jgi:hypothetical protein
MGNERRFVLGETIELAVPLEVLPDAIRAHLGLYGSNTGRHSDIEESVLHGGSPLRDAGLG